MERRWRKRFQGRGSGRGGFGGVRVVVVVVGGGGLGGVRLVVVEMGRVRERIGDRR